MKKALIILTTLAIGAGTVTAYTAIQRPDCPGQTTCPLTGERICVDRCPMSP